jgi:hypothetical protein
MSFELKLAIQGKLSEFLASEITHAARAVTLGVADSVESGRLIARQQVRSAGMGDRLANSWRHRVFPDKLGKFSLNAAGSVYSKAPHIIDIYAKGGTIVPVNGRKYLAIPTSYLRNVVPTLVGNRHLSKKVTPAAVARHLGVKLVLRRNRHGTLWLEAGGLRLSRGKRSRGIAKRASDTAIAKGKALTLPLFWLVKSVSVGRRLDLNAILAQMERQIEANVLRHWQDS